MREWREYSLTEFAEFNPKIGVQPDQEYSFVEMPDLEPGRKHVYPSGKRKPNGLTKFQNGDTLFAKITPCLENGKISQVQGLVSNTGVGSTEFFVFRGRENLSDNDFVYYLMRWYSVKKYAEKNMSGSAGHQRVPADCLHNLKLPLPPYEENKKIGVLLSCLDNKIENLQRQNQILEKMAQTLFKQWFVDFNFPDENGNPYKDSCGEMVASELGDIPRGWQYGTLGSVADVTSSKRIFLSEYQNEGIPFFRSKEIIELRSGKVVSTEIFISHEKFDEIKKKFGAPTEGDILLTSVGTIGVPYLVKKEDCFYFKDGNLTWIKNFKNGFSGVFLYFWLLSKSSQHQINFNTIGSTQKALTIVALKNLQLLIPTPKTLENFSKILCSLNQKIEKNGYHIQSLIQTRDTLLPKLMSGKIRVSD